MTDQTQDQATLEDEVQPEGAGKTEIAEYTETAAALARLEFRMKDVVHDVTTVKGMDAAKRDRAELRTLRVTLDKTRLAKNEDDQARIKRRNEEAKRITARIEALEDPIAEQIKAEEQRKEDEKIARQQAEQARAQALRTRIETMAGLALRSVGKPSIYVAEKIALLEGMGTDDFEEITPVAVNTKAETLEKLRELLAAASAQEKAAEDLAEANRQLAAQQAETQRLEREAQARRDAETAAERQRQQAIDEAQRKAQAEAAAKLAADQAEFDRQRAAFEAEKTATRQARELQERQQREAEEEQRRQAAHADEKDRQMAIPSVAHHVEATDTRPPITTGMLCERFGFTVNAAFITGLGFTPAERPVGSKVGTFWREADFLPICAAIARHVESIAMEHAVPGVKMLEDALAGNLPGFIIK